MFAFARLPWNLVCNSFKDNMNNLKSCCLYIMLAGMLTLTLTIFGPREFNWGPIPWVLFIFNIVATILAFKGVWHIAKMEIPTLGLGALIWGIAKDDMRKLDKVVLYNYKSVRAMFFLMWLFLLNTWLHNIPMFYPHRSVMGTITVLVAAILMAYAFGSITRVSIPKQSTGRNIFIPLLLIAAYHFCLWMGWMNGSMSLIPYTTLAKLAIVGFMIIFYVGQLTGVLYGIGTVIWLIGLTLLAFQQEITNQSVRSSRYSASTRYIEYEVLSGGADVFDKVEYNKLKLADPSRKLTEASYFRVNTGIGENGFITDWQGTVFVVGWPRDASKDIPDSTAVYILAQSISVNPTEPLPIVISGHFPNWRGAMFNTLFEGKAMNDTALLEARLDAAYQDMQQAGIAPLNSWSTVQYPAQDTSLIRKTVISTGEGYGSARDWSGDYRNHKWLLSFPRHTPLIAPFASRVLAAKGTWNGEPSMLCLVALKPQPNGGLLSATFRNIGYRVDVGDTLSQGQFIGYSTADVETNAQQLGFELRLNTQSMNPELLVNQQYPGMKAVYAYTVGTNERLVHSEFVLQTLKPDSIGNYGGIVCQLPIDRMFFRGPFLLKKGDVIWLRVLLPRGTPLYITDSNRADDVVARTGLTPEGTTYLPLATSNAQYSFPAKANTGAITIGVRNRIYGQAIKKGEPIQYKAEDDGIFIICPAHEQIGSRTGSSDPSYDNIFRIPNDTGMVMRRIYANYTIEIGVRDDAGNNITQQRLATHFPRLDPDAPPVTFAGIHTIDW